MGQYYRIPRKNVARAMLVCEGCTLRPWRRGDEARLVELADNTNVSRYMSDVFPSPYRMDDALAWIALNEADRSRVHFALEVDGELAGGIGVEPQAAEQRIAAEIGYWLGEPYWGRGIMTSAVRTLTQHAFETLPLRRIWAGIYHPNLASQRVLEKAGYTREAVLRNAIIKQGEIYDKIIYSVVR